MTPAILWLTGWGMPDSCWEQVRRQLPCALHLAPDFSRVSRPEEFYEAVEQTARSVAGKELVVVGWSMGGLLALRLAASRPVAGLVLVGATMRFVRESAERDRGWGAAVLQRMKRLLPKDRERIMAQFAEQMLTAKERGQNRVDTGTAGAQWSQQALLAGLDYLAREDCRHKAASLSCPAVVIHGTDDLICPLAAGEELAGALPAAEFVRLQDCGHAPHIFYPDVVGTAVTRMVKQIAQKHGQASVQ
ncbi:alpha/beta hydrolase [Brevibacillus agri]|uniref:alpha/beta fold hydrolase n=1 Tax=Brevibacillus agri TaxID=51101 RepID=UPI0028708BAD|nr:alpha/beta hydrolase [Brevibacillus agri]MDR9504509.1 alpha/beta hydrolase [Brevibacillus agri]